MTMLRLLKTSIFSFGFVVAALVSWAQVGGGFVAGPPTITSLGGLPLTGGTVTGPISTTAGTITANAPGLDISQTWNNAGVVFSALKVNVTDTASTYPSYLVNLQRAGAFVFGVDSFGALSSTNTFNFAGAGTVQGNTAIPAGGTTGAGYKFSTTANFGVFFGSGAPTLSAAKGSLYLRSDGSGVADRMYINADGGTTWTAVTTAG